MTERKKPVLAHLRGKPKDLQAYSNVFELLHMVDGVLYMRGMNEPGGDKADDR